MSVEILSRERGAVIRCGNGSFAGCPPCPESITTGQIQAGLIRAVAARQGWGRSKMKGFFRVDLCPAHVREDRERTRESRRVRCGHPGCAEMFEARTALTKRQQAALAGWGRASPKGRGSGAKRHDLCPAHIGEERARLDGIAAAKVEAKAAARKKREEKERLKSERAAARESKRAERAARSKPVQHAEVGSP